MNVISYTGTVNGVDVDGLANDALGGTWADIPERGMVRLGYSPTVLSCQLWDSLSRMSL